MSVKAMSLVWDLKCPQTINDLEFRPNHKFILMAYADHADHHGKSIWPSVKTISEKTGLDERTVQRMTRDMEKMGLLADDGQGPRGTRRWKLPFSAKGDSLTPVEVHADTGGSVTGGKPPDSLGDIPLGDIPLSGTVPPEFKEPEPNQLININNISDVWGDTKEKIKDNIKSVDFETWVIPTDAIALEDKTLIVGALNDRAKAWLVKNLTAEAQDALGLYVKFVTFAEMNLAEAAQ